MSNTNFIKPIAMVACVVAGDKYILGETDMTKSMYFGAAGAAGVFSAQMIAPMLPLEKFLPSGAYTDSKTLELRILEIGGAVGLGFVLNRYVLRNDPFVNIQVNKLALLAGADFVSEYIDDYMSGRPLSFFK
jgi:hypothetical protein